MKDLSMAEGYREQVTAQYADRKALRKKILKTLRAASAAVLADVDRSDAHRINWGYPPLNREALRIRAGVNIRQSATCQSHQTKEK
jgi:hypothetical protein